MSCNYKFKAVLDSVNKDIYENAKNYLNELVECNTKPSIIFSKLQECQTNCLNYGRLIGLDLYSLNYADSTMVNLWLINPNPKFDLLKETYFHGAAIIIVLNSNSDLEKIANEELIDL
ncbi:MAG: hypothetical protein PHN56_04390, partial [Candidatus Nanoarchaeia archaeon]|nr:hypothetical protein [Candidatus Nanoarchaeia archaeon]